MNGSAGEIPKCCGGVVSVDAIVAALGLKFDIPALWPDMKALLAHTFEQD